MALREQDSKITYIRFQTRVQDEHSHRPSGVFMAVHKLRENNEVTPYHLEELERHLSWLRMHLKSPRELKEVGNERALSWFHPRAKEPIKRVRAMVEILREYGVVIDQVSTEKPGYVVYEDGWQIVAKPFRK